MNKNAICYSFKNNMPSKVDGYHHFETIRLEVFEELSIGIKELFEQVFKPRI